MNIEETIVEKLRSLPSPKQQEVLDFVLFLHSQIHTEEIQTQEKEPVSFLTAAKKWAGCIDGGPTDLSYNKKYLEGALPK
ncbi:MAG: DUF2281 domain-containing protein [Hormoscilla sp. GUM202]|nr:DUF2281 domain-containing protein [Hormoscilla sp. GUM202]